MSGRLIGLSVVVDGEPSRSRPRLIVSNHVSSLDIVVLSACTPLTFVVKSEVAGWPFPGRLAKFQQAVFVDRDRKLTCRTVVEEIAGQMLAGLAVVLFAEGTSSDGSAVLSFRSAVIGAAAAAMSAGGGGPGVSIQPLAVSYPSSGQRVAAWYGDMAFLRHLPSVLVATAASFGLLQTYRAGDANMRSRRPLNRF